MVKKNSKKNKRKRTSSLNRKSGLAQDEKKKTRISCGEKEKDIGGGHPKKRRRDKIGVLLFFCNEILSHKV